MHIAPVRSVQHSMSVLKVQPVFKVSRSDTDLLNKSLSDKPSLNSMGDRQHYGRGRHRQVK